jgi:protein-tyrosine phosphatase
MRILLVCLGNICRSPAAEAALRAALADAGLGDRVEVDSAGTGDWHIGRPPDPRMMEAATAGGLALAGTARQVSAQDFHDCDLILVMDQANLEAVRALAPDDQSAAKVKLFLSYTDGSFGDVVPDPYYGEADGFARVVEVVRAGAAGVVEAIRRGEIT